MNYKFAVKQFSQLEFGCFNNGIFTVFNTRRNGHSQQLFDLAVSVPGQWFWGQE
jgi:hypothetical protein